MAAFGLVSFSSFGDTIDWIYLLLGISLLTDWFEVEHKRIGKQRIFRHVQRVGDAASLHTQIVIRYQTGRPLPAGATRFNTFFTAGMSNTVFSPGTVRKNPSIAGITPANSPHIPYSSTANPTHVHPHTTSTTPITKNMDPLKFFGFIKKISVEKNECFIYNFRFKPMNGFGLFFCAYPF